MSSKKKTSKGKGKKSSKGKKDSKKDSKASNKAQVIAKRKALLKTLASIVPQEDARAIRSLVNSNLKVANEIGEIIIGLSKLPEEDVPRRPDRWVFTDDSDNIKENFEADYIKGEQLGEPGQYGVAFECRHKRTGDEFAVKIIDKSRMFFKGMSVDDRIGYFQQFKQEIGIMQNISHDNLIRLYDVYEDPARVYLVMEKCTGGELFVRIQQKNTYSEKDAAAVLAHLARGIEALHKQKIAHCDLKPENCLFLNDDEDSPLKIIDFGMSKYSSGTDITGIRGSTYYIAPEIITESTYAYHCDMWSFGIIAFVMLFGFPPFFSREDDDDDVFELIKDGFEPVTKEGYGKWFPEQSTVSDAAKAFIASCLKTDVAARCTASEALNNPWLTGKDASSEPLLDDVVKGLAQFTNKCKFRQVVLGTMTDLLSEQELAMLKQTFESIDTDGNGVITKDELMEAMKQHDSENKEEGGMSTQIVAKLMEFADVDGDGQLSYKELISVVVQRKMSNKEERIWEAFCRFDLNGDGLISREELQQIFSGEDNVDELIESVDQNKDGCVDYDEFLAMWRVKEEEDLNNIMNKGSGDSEKS